MPCVQQHATKAARHKRHSEVNVLVTFKLVFSPSSITVLEVVHGETGLRVLMLSVYFDFCGSIEEKEILDQVSLPLCVQTQW